jgi:hypothetical protein
LREHAEEIGCLICGNEAIEGSGRGANRSDDLTAAAWSAAGDPAGFAIRWAASHQEEPGKECRRDAKADVA